jgi:hypothetical protein
MDVMILTTGQIQQFQRCKLEYRAQRDKDNDVIMGEAPPSGVLNINILPWLSAAARTDDQ